MKGYLPQLDKIKIDSEKEALKEFVLLLKYYNYIQDAVYSKVVADKEIVTTLNEVLLAVHPYISALNRWSENQGLEILSYKMGNGLSDIIFKSQDELSDLAQIRLEQYNQWFNDNLEIAWKILNRGLKLLDEDIDNEEREIAKDFYDENLINATLLRANHKELLTSRYIQIRDLEEFWQDWQYINYEVSNLNLDDFDLTEQQRLYLYSMALNIKEDQMTVINNKLGDFEQLLEEASIIQDKFESLLQSTDKNEIMEKFIDIKDDTVNNYQETLNNLVNIIKSVQKEWLHTIDSYRGLKTLIRAPHLIEEEEMKELSPDLFLKEE